MSLSVLTSAPFASRTSLRALGLRVASPPASSSRRSRSRARCSRTAIVAREQPMAFATWAGSSSSPIAQQQCFAIDRRESPQRSGQLLVEQLGPVRLFDCLGAEPLAQAFASRCSTALVGERAPCNPVEPRKRVLWKCSAPAPSDHEHLRRDLLGGLTIGSTERIAMHRGRIALVEAGHRLQLIAGHTSTMAGRASPITYGGEIIQSAHACVSTSGRLGRSQSRASCVNTGRRTVPGVLTRCCCTPCGMARPGHLPQPHSAHGRLTLVCPTGISGLWPGRPGTGIEPEGPFTVTRPTVMCEMPGHWGLKKVM